jgi:hypothetical protein
MISETPRRPAGVLDVELTYPDAANAASGALAAALEFCAGRMGLSGPEAALGLLKAGDSRGRAYFEYDLGKQIAEYISALDAEVQSAYLYEDEATPDDSAFGEPGPMMVHMILWVKRKTQALSSVVEGMEQALGRRWADLIGVSGPVHLLDAQIVDDNEVRAGTGIAALLKGIHQPPLPIWKR